MKNIKYGIVIGRFNPPHLGHFHLIEAALSKSDYVIVVNGSYKAAYSPKKLLNENEIQTIIRAGVSAPNKLIFVNVRDNLYDDQDWVLNVRKQVKWVAAQCTEPNTHTFTIFGYDKDHTSQYLKWFPLYDVHEVQSSVNDSHGNVIHATDIRNFMYKTWDIVTSEYGANPLDFEEMVSKYLNSVMGMHAYNALMDILDYNRLSWITEEYNHYQSYKKAWENAPYAPVFVTCDAVVISNGCVLVIKRKDSPGRGCWALPGGFLNTNEKIKDGIIRELKEETKIRIPPGKLIGSLKTIEVFDAPGRSQRGRTITHAGLFILDENELPKIVGSDDAESATWIPLENIGALEGNFFEDHYHIVRHMMKFVN